MGCRHIRVAKDSSPPQILLKRARRALPNFPCSQVNRSNQAAAAQFTSAAFTSALAAKGAAISINRRGRFIDNVFIERLWRSLQQVEVYLKAYADGPGAQLGISSWMEFYNERRLHQVPGYRAPMALSREKIAGAKAVDMMDKACALPTGLWQQKQTPPLAARQEKKERPRVKLRNQFQWSRCAGPVQANPSALASAKRPTLKGG